MCIRDRDRNGVLPESIVVNAFENTLDINVSKDILLQQINHANVISLYTIHLINDTYRSVSKYDLTDEIEIAIPLDKIIYNRYVRAIVIGEETVKEVNLRTENGYLIIQTDTMGDFVFFTGEGQIISTQNEKKETLRVQIDVNHPGIPNYDAEYTVRVLSLIHIFFTPFRVQHCGGLVQNKNFRAHCENPCNGYTLLLTARELMSCMF